MTIDPLGDSALIVRIDDEFRPDASLNAVLVALRCLEAAELPGVIELAPAYTTIGVFFDPARVAGFDELKTKIERALQPSVEPARPRAETGSVVDVPGCYENEFALDLGEVAEFTGLSEEEIVQRHSSASYRVHCVGFTPGFPFLG